MQKTFSFSIKKYPIKVNDFKLGKAVECPNHGIHLDWNITYKGRLQEYLWCKICNRQNAKSFAHKNINYVLYNYAKQHCKKSGYKFEITEDDINQLFIKQKNKCAYTKKTFNLDKNRASLDQILPKNGYTKKNIQLVLIDVNKIKSDLSENDFLKYCKLINRPIKAKSSNLPLLKYAKRRKDKENVLNDIKKFKNEGKLTCEIHGLHKFWVVYEKDQISNIKCGECSKKFHIFYNKKDVLKKRKINQENKKINLKNIELFKLNKKCYCKIHGYHKKFRLKMSKNHKYIQCKICDLNYGRKYRSINLFSAIFSGTKYKTNKKISRFSFDLKFNDLIDMYVKQEGRCAYTSIEFDANKYKPSIDRIDSNKGYTLKNSHLIVYDVNRMKTDLSVKRFKHLCSQVYENSNA